MLSRVVPARADRGAPTPRWPTPGGRCGSRACSSGRRRSRPSLLFGLSDRAGDFDPAGLTTPFGATGDVLAAPLGRWDSVWFLAIADGGYDDGAREAFFPLYPLLVRIAGAPLGSALIGGALLSTALLGVALVLLHRLVALDHDRAVARNAVLVTALFPMSFFFSAVYSESLFLALSIGAVYAARRERWAWAGRARRARRDDAQRGRAAARAAGDDLPLGRRRGRSLRARRPLRPDALWLALVPLGLGAVLRAARRSTAMTRSRRFAPRRSGFARSPGPFVGAWDGLVAAWQGARQLLSGAREPVYFTACGRRSVRRRAPQHRAVRVARARARRDRRRAAPAARRLRRLRRRGARAAALLSGRPAAAHVAAALRRGALSAGDLAGRCG